MYVLIYLLTGNLPWKSFKANDAGLDKMFAMKKKIDSEVLCEGTCSEFINIIEYLRHLAPGEEVDFTIVEGMFH